MSSPIQTPQGANLLSALMQNSGFQLNAITSALVGTSDSETSYSPGSLVTDTCLNNLTQAIQAGYNTLGIYLDATTYGNLITIGSGTIPALGNSMPPTYTWIGPATTGTTVSTAAQVKSWYPYTATATTNVYPTSAPTPRQWSEITSTNYTPDITQWGWIRLFALQAVYEFNWNNDPTADVSYKDFLSSFMTASGFLETTNNNIHVLSNALTFLKNTYSNNNDLSTSDITGVNLATVAFGTDLIASGKAIDLATLDTFGLPSNLLLTLKKYNAITGSLTYAIMSAGISTSDLRQILNGTAPTKFQEQQLYGAYNIITGADLADILIPLNCSTPGLMTLADLLNPRTLFPTSYLSLTVPVYNSAPASTNAKTYYRIYGDNGVNVQQLTLPEVVRATGSAGLATVNTGNTVQIQPVGYGAYSRGTIPDDISVAAGAFSFSMLQINNIRSVPIEKFAQVVFNIETMANLPLTTGTNIPSNPESATAGLDQMAYGSGPNGTFTMSDFFGCMSGLPYQWTDVKTLILQLQTSNLASIYANIYSTISSAVADVSIVVQGYIDAANAEIASILTANPNVARDLNRMWNASGTQLTTEQTARNIALSTVPVPRSNYIAAFPSTVFGFVNDFNSNSKKTAPNMHAQTLEAISDVATVGGQAQVGLMRAMRNKEKLMAAGIKVDSTIPENLPPLTDKILSGNGTVSIARPGRGIPAEPATFTIPADQHVLPLPVHQVGHFENEDNYYCLPTAMKAAPVLGSIPHQAEIGQDLAGPHIRHVESPINPVAGGSEPHGACTPLDLGKPMVPGSLGGSPYQNLVPPQLSVPFTSGTLSTPTYTVQQAIEEVIRCNCDCWLD